MLLREPTSLQQVPVPACARGFEAHGFLRGWMLFPWCYFYFYLHADIKRGNGNESMWLAPGSRMHWVFELYEKKTPGFLFTGDALIIPCTGTRHKDF
jgi:hypothetical protein